MKIQARSFINAAEAGYQTLQEQAQNQFMEMAMNHRQQIAGLEMMQGQKVSFLEMNLAQQQHASMDFQRRLTETESVQAQLLKELRELKGRKDEVPKGLPKFAIPYRSMKHHSQVYLKPMMSDLLELLICSVLHPRSLNPEA